MNLSLSATDQRRRNCRKIPGNGADVTPVRSPSGRRIGAGAGLTLALVAVLAAAAWSDTPPTVAVLDFDTSALTSNAYGTFEPGIAVPDLLADRLVNGGRFDVLDRAYVDETLERHHARGRGIVDPGSAVATGRMLGARYLVTGTIAELDADGGGDAASNDRLTLAVAIRVVDTTTGRVVQSFSDEKTERAKAVADDAFADYTAGDYGFARFVDSPLGRLIDDEAAALAANLNPSKFKPAPARPLLDGHAIEVDGKSVIVDVGAARGAVVGAVFDVVRTDSGETIGKLEILSVAPGTSVGRLLSGTAASGDAVQSE
jgi:curli biogenesis system outer membrane secretion channel CsgG